MYFQLLISSVSEPTGGVQCSTWVVLIYLPIGVNKPDTVFPGIPHSKCISPLEWSIMLLPAQTARCLSSRKCLYGFKNRAPVAALGLPTGFLVGVCKMGPWFPKEPVRSDNQREERGCVMCGTQSNTQGIHGDDHL